MNIKKKKCLICNQIFQPKGCNQKYCENCSIVKTNCIICGKEIKTKRSKYNQGYGKKCYPRCKFIYKDNKNYYKDYKEKNKNSIKQSLKQYYFNNKEKINKRRKTKHRRKKQVIYTHNYNAKKRKNGGKFIEKEWKYIKWLYNYRCAICQKKIKLTIDHIIPVSKGGINNFDNIQPLCGSCNSSKGSTYKSRVF